LFHSIFTSSRPKAETRLAASSPLYPSIPSHFSPSPGRYGIFIHSQIFLFHHLLARLLSYLSRKATE
ncbi:hypothetical protein PFISCL1PPCAC_12962, partial [Pristionchus fissidentatus]